MALMPIKVMKLNLQRFHFCHGVQPIGIEILPYTFWALLSSFHFLRLLISASVGGSNANDPVFRSPAGL